MLLFFRTPARTGGPVTVDTLWGKKTLQVWESNTGGMFVLTDGTVSYATIYHTNSYGDVCVRLDREYGDFPIQLDAEKIMVDGQYMTLDEAVVV